MCFILSDCMKIQTEAIKNFEPDVVISSSFGAAVVVYGILENRFKAPIVLCASAHDVLQQDMFQFWMHERQNRDGEKGAKIPPDVPVVIIHGGNDYTVPVQHSRHLYALLKKDAERKSLNTLTKYYELPEEGHRLRSILSMDSSIQEGETLLETSILDCIKNNQT